MRRIFVSIVIPVFLAVFGGFLVYDLVNSAPDVDVCLRLPGEFVEPEVELGPIKIEGELALFDGVAGDIAGAWPWFRGERHDAISLDENIKLAGSWPDAGPEVLWSVDVGEGYAGPAILNGKVYLVDYDHENLLDVIRCMSLDDGKDIWRYSYPVKIKRYHGMSRTVPAVTDKYIVTMGPKCHVTCLDTETGKFRWMLNLPREYNTEVPMWYAGQCPLIEDGKAIIAPAGDVLMMAVDCESGEVVWETENRHGWVMTHSSILPMEFAGRRMYVYCGNGGVVGVSAEDGAVLWESMDWKMRTNVPSPLVVGDGLIFLCAGYGKGSLMLRLTETDGKIVPETVFTLKPKVFGSDQHTPVFYEGHIYGVRPDWQMVCLDLAGNVVWSSTSAYDFKKLGPFMIANGLMYAMNGDGRLTLAEVSAGGFKVLAEAQVLDGIESWAPMAIASGRLIVRDLTKMKCLDVSEH